MRNNNRNIDRRVATLEKACLEDRERWRRNDGRWERTHRTIVSMIEVIRALNGRLDQHIRESNERWQKNDARLDAMLRSLHRLMEK